MHRTQEVRTSLKKWDTYCLRQSRALRTVVVANACAQPKDIFRSYAIAPEVAVRCVLYCVSLSFLTAGLACRS